MAGLLGTDRDPVGKTLRLINHLREHRGDPDLEESLRTAIDVAVDLGVKSSELAIATGLDEGYIDEVLAERRRSPADVLLRLLRFGGNEHRAREQRVGRLVREAVDVGVPLRDAASRAGLTEEEATVLMDQT